MAVFISYSHSDKALVDKLAAMLFKSRTPVWLDRWELNVGDSLIRRIEEAITNATAVIFVLSKSSVESDWCRKELSAGLIRELEEKRVLVLPLLLEDCDIPLFVRDKKYADFRTDFDAGFRDITTALARVTTDTQGRIEDKGGSFTDWSSSWSVDSKGIVKVQVVIVDHAKDYPFTILSIVDILLNERASERHRELAAASLEPLARQLVLACLTETPICDDLFVYLDSSSPVERTFGMSDPKIGVEFHATAVCRILGTDTGRDTVVNLGSQLRSVSTQSQQVLVPLARHGDIVEMRRIMTKYRPDFPG